MGARVFGAVRRVTPTARAECACVQQWFQLQPDVDSGDGNGNGDGNGDDSGDGSGDGSSADALNEFFCSCDVVVNVLPCTPATRRILSRDTLRSVQDVVFVNVGRGTVIDDDTLMWALDTGIFRFAVLDVFNQEPLPTAHALWRHPRARVTPHIAAVTRASDVVDVWMQNAAAFTEGNSMAAEVDFDRGY
jgi:phosphoglycerate dehydrogenase-like enzyme